MALKKKMSPYQYLARQKEFQQRPRSERKAIAGAYGMELSKQSQNQEASRQRKKNRRKIRREGEKAKAYFSEALKQKSGESNLARGGRQFVKGVSGSLRRARGKGAGVIRLPKYSAGWSDMGLILGTPFKDYKAKNVFPSSLRDRTLHPQEKAEIDAAIQKVRLFGVNPNLSPIPEEVKKKTKQNEENQT